MPGCWTTISYSSSWISALGGLHAKHYGPKCAPNTQCFVGNAAPVPLFKRRPPLRDHVEPENSGSIPGISQTSIDTRDAVTPLKTSGVGRSCHRAMSIGGAIYAVSAVSRLIAEVFQDGHFETTGGFNG